ncbi:MAG: DinB family protein [Actinomycetota bacterium]
MTAVEEIVYLLEEAFSGVGIEESNESQSLLVNLRSVEEPMWRALPVGGARTIESIALHVGSCTVMYDEYAFGAGELTWNDQRWLPWKVGEASIDATVAWLEDVHGRFVDHVRSLVDADLGELRPTNWGELRETRWLISTMLQHDVYHAGEVNHLRSILVANDAWRWG